MSNHYVRRRGMVGRVPAFERSGPSSVLDRVRNFNLSPRTACVSLICVLSCVVSSEGSDILLTTDSGSPALVFLSSVHIPSLWLPLQSSDLRVFEL